MKVQEVAIDRVRPYPGNPRRNDQAVEKVARSLEAFGWRQPIVVDEEFVVIAGHTRLAAARSLAMTRVPVHVAVELTKSQVKAYRIADNRTGEEAEWDWAALALEVNSLRIDGVDLDITGFDESEIARFLQQGETPRESPPDSSLELGVFVSCAGEVDQRALYEQLTAEGWTCRLIT
jgi:ParB-like chromosome segregation protein Spo0J